MSVLDDLAENPALAASLSPDECDRLLAQCAAMILLLSKTPRQKPPAALPDQMLTAKEVAMRLNLSEAWVRDHAETDLRSVRVTLGGALRFSARALDVLIQNRRGD